MSRALTQLHLLTPAGFALFVTGNASVATAHEYWLQPSDFAPRPGTSISIEAFAGTGFRGEWKPWSPFHGARFVIRTAKTFDLSTVASPGDRDWARFAPTDRGGALVAFVSDFTPITLPPDAFDRYLDDEGLHAAKKARDGHGARAGREIPGRERYRRCAKAWIAGDDADRATRPLGLPLEIVPTTIPGATQSLRLRVEREGRPAAGLLVKAWRVPPGGAFADPGARDSVGVAYRGTTDAHGGIEIPTAERGQWLISAVDMKPSADRQAADWESTWASLTFARF